jgi:hypothetical protein
MNIPAVEGMRLKSGVVSELFDLIHCVAVRLDFGAGVMIVPGS